MGASNKVFLLKDCIKLDFLIKLIPCRNIQQAEFHRVNCCLHRRNWVKACPSLFDENMKDIPKRRNIRKARRNKRKK